MSISLDEVRHVARLARLELNESEMMTLQGELNSLLGHLIEIQNVQANLLELTSHAVQLRNVWSDDLPRDPLPRASVLKNSALTKAGLFVVPAIIEE